MRIENAVVAQDVFGCYNEKEVMTCEKTGFDSTKALDNSRDENGELKVANTPKRRVAAEVDKPARRVANEYKILSEN